MRPTPLPRSPVKYLVHMNQRPHKACHPSSCSTGDTQGTWAMDCGLGAARLGCHLSAGSLPWRELTVQPPNPARPPPPQGWWWGASGTSLALLLSQVPHNVGPRDVSAPPGVRSGVPPLSSQWHLQPFLFDSKSRFISTDGDADITTEKQNISSGLIAGL